MPIRRRYPKRTYRKKTLASSGYTPSALLKQARYSNNVGCINAVITTMGVFSDDTLGRLLLANEIALGNSADDRAGDTVKLLRAEIHGVLYGNATAVRNRASIFIVHDKKPTGTLPLPSTIIVPINSYGFQRVDNATRFTILARKDYNLVGSGTSATATRPVINVDFSVNLRGLLTNYVVGSTTGVLSNIESGALYVFTAGDAGTGTLAATFDGYIRTYFQDA